MNNGLVWGGELAGTVNYCGSNRRAVVPDLAYKASLKDVRATFGPLFARACGIFRHFRVKTHLFRLILLSLAAPRMLVVFLVLCVVYDEPNFFCQTVGASSVTEPCTYLMTTKPIS